MESEGRGGGENTKLITMAICTRREGWSVGMCVGGEGVEGCMRYRFGLRILHTGGLCWNVCVWRGGGGKEHI